MTERITHAPWTASQILNLLDYQDDPLAVPYTCRAHSGKPLLPTRSGWVCQVAGCDYRQDWAHAMDVRR